MLRMNLLFNPLLWIILFGSVQISYSQTKQLDSLQGVLKTHHKMDTTRVQLINKIVSRLVNHNIDSSKVLVQQSEKLADSLNYIKGKATCLSLNGVIQQHLSNYKNALEYFQSAKKMHVSIANKKGILYCNTYIGRMYTYMSNYEKAIEYYELNLQEQKETNDKRGIAVTKSNVGVIYYYIGKYKKSKENYKEALQIFKEIGENKHLIGIYSNLGNLYGAQGNYSAALEYYHKAANAQKKIGDNPRFGVRNFIRIGSTYGKLEDYDRALEYYQNALHIAEKLHDKLSMGMCLGNIGQIYQSQGKIEESINVLEKALKLSEDINSKSFMSNILNSLGDVQVSAKEYTFALQHYKNALKINLETGNLNGTSKSYFGVGNIFYKKKAINEALSYALKAQKLADELKVLERQKNVSELLSKIYHDKGDYKKAYANQLVFKKLNDSLFNKKSIQKMAQLEYEYEYKERLDSAANRETILKKEVKTIDTKLEDSKQQKAWWIIGFLGSLILLGFAFFLLRIRKLKTQKQSVLMEQRLLRSQMNPHFMFNTLSAIKTQIKKDQNKGLEYLSKFSKHLRLVLENSLNNYVLLSKELEALKNYMDLELHRFPNSFVYSFNLENIKEDDFLFIPPMLLQPFIENSIKHGFLNINYQGEIIISLKKNHPKYIRCEIKDNGTGTIKQKAVDKDSLSTKLITTFIEKATKSKVKIINQLGTNKENTGVIITFLIPYNSKGND